MKIALLTKTRPDLQQRIAALDNGIEHVFLEADINGVWSEEALAQVDNADAFLVGLEPVNEQIAARAPKLKIVQRMGVGYETLDLEACAKRGVPCCNIEGVNKEAVSEHGMMLIMMLAKNLLQADELMHTDEGWGKARLVSDNSMELAGKTIGIVGLGNTGGQLARKARGFGMKVLYNDLKEADPKIVEQTGARAVEKDELFRTADIISINVDLNETSRQMVTAEVLKTLKPNTFLVCCARGGIIDEQALADALNEGRLAGAGIDVFEQEPFEKDNPLLNARNCIVTAHVAGSAVESAARNWDWAYENILRVIQNGEKPKWVRNGVT